MNNRFLVPMVIVAALGLAACGESEETKEQQGTPEGSTSKEEMSTGQETPKKEQ